tara:strand:+ start:248 stop:565 length:318 start_codon:yes stop_codon:yes gene_type:complete
MVSLGVLITFSEMRRFLFFVSLLFSFLKAMKKLLYISFLFSICLFAQTNTQYIEQDRPLNLVEGWNMIGFTCNEPINVIDAFLPIYDKVIIAKDNNGAVYMPEFG